MPITFRLAVQFDCWLCIARYPWFVKENVFININFIECVRVFACDFAWINSIERIEDFTARTQINCQVESYWIECELVSHLIFGWCVQIDFYIFTQSFVRKRAAISFRFFFHFDWPFHGRPQRFCVLFQLNSKHTRIECVLMKQITSLSHKFHDKFEC